MEDFTPVSEVDLQHFKENVAKAAATGRGVVATFGGTAFGDIALVPAINMKHPRGVREIADWYMLTASRPDYVHAVFEHQCDVALANLARIHAAVGNAVSAVFVCGTDFGTQSSQFCSPETFRELYAPYYKRVNSWIHKNTTWKSFKHSCGSVEVLINDFIDAGFDILNPVQIAAAGMDPLRLKQQYGERIVFWGGGVDTQKTLPFGTPEQVRTQVLRLCEIFGKDGGFVFNTVHNIQANTPVENVVAMLKAVREA
jgi:uroporphyrinogen-III decarboxylase